MTRSEPDISGASGPEPDDQGQSAHNLREAEQIRFSRFLASPVVTLLLDPQNGRILKANQAAHNFYGHSAEQMSDMHLGDISALPLASVLENLDQSQTAERPNVIHRMADGSGRHVETTVTSINLEGKQLLWMRVIDVTSRHLAMAHSAKLVLAIEQCPNPVFITNLAGDIEYVNEAFVSVTGYSREFAVGRNPRILNSGKTPPATYAAMWAALARDGSWSGEFCNRRKDGTEYYEHANVALLLGQKGANANYLALKQDITARRLADEQSSLQRSQVETQLTVYARELADEVSRFKDLADMVPCGIFRIRTDPDLRTHPEPAAFEISLTSKRYQELLGISAEQARAENGGLLQRLHADDLAGFYDFVRTTCCGTAPASWEGRLLIRNDERWMRIDAVPKMAGGALVVNAILQDIDEQKRRRGHIFRSIIEASPDAYFAVDRDRIIRGWSQRAEELLGYPAEAIIGLPMSLVIQQPSAAGDNQIIPFPETIPDSGRQLGPLLRLQARTRGGEMIPIELRMTAFMEDGIPQFAGFMRDISDRLEAQQRLVASNKMETVGQIAGGIAHDFNNLFGIIMGNLELLSEDVTGDDNLESVDTAMSAVARGVAITKALLAVAGRSSSVPRITDIPQTLQALQPLLQSVAGKSARLIIRCDEKDRLCCLIGSGEINATLFNIVQNAREAMPDGGTLEIGVTTQAIAEDDGALATGMYVAISLTDSGCGMQPAVKEKAFDPFFTTKNRGQGTGLGLSMAMGYVTQQGGTIRIRSEPGKGSTVTVLLPLHSGAAAPLTPIANTRHAAKKSTRPHVLLVDDEPALLKVISRWLSDFGFEVTTADSAETALQALALRRFEVMLSDVIMPGMMNGIALGHRAQEINPEMHILLVSGYPGEFGTEGPLKFPLLQKPLSRTVLQHALRQWQPSHSA